MSALWIDVSREPTWLRATDRPWGWCIGDERTVITAGRAETEELARIAAETVLPEVQARWTAQRRAAYTGLARWAFEP